MGEGWIKEAEDWREMEKGGFEGGGTGVRERPGNGLGAAFSLTYISASQNQHSCQQAGEVGIHCV